MVKLH